MITETLRPRRTPVPTEEPVDDTTTTSSETTDTTEEDPSTEDLSELLPDPEETDGSSDAWSSSENSYQDDSSSGSYYTPEPTTYTPEPIQPTPSPTPDQDVIAASSSSGNSSPAGTVLSVALAVIIVAMIAAFVFKTWKKRKLDAAAKASEDDVFGPPTVSIELPPTAPSDFGQSMYSQSGFGQSGYGPSARQHSSLEQSMFHTTGAVSPTHASAERPTTQSAMFQGPASTTYRLVDQTPSTMASGNLIPMSSVRSTTTRTTTTGFDHGESYLQQQPSSRMHESNSTVNSLHDSTSSDRYALGDGLGRQHQQSQGSVRLQPPVYRESDESPVLSISDLGPPTPPDGNLPSASSTALPPLPPPRQQPPPVPITPEIVDANELSLHRPPPPGLTEDDLKEETVARFTGKSSRSNGSIEFVQVVEIDEHGRPHEFEI
ncbi:hypothetical protein Poli38472_009601 [Pythium oligandrum]|uniref:Uncharacterized protein n=1 Tax=Pythium oligandrum TaxID=41045 RepID=A0A8K1CGJ0_PYTOL|nr:hypothetical protein Poli38472_009601 [Pythium oligandrum]|eukprot:TMW62108.1 hypothetical protein Poli38472_009601 [Pythium oligandrum]